MYLALLSVLETFGINAKIRRNISNVTNTSEFPCTSGTFEFSSASHDGTYTLIQVIKVIGIRRENLACISSITIDWQQVECGVAVALRKGEQASLNGRTNDNAILFIFKRKRNCEFVLRLLFRKRSNSDIITHRVFNKGIVELSIKIGVKFQESIIVIKTIF
jgi:hypothetical protein